MSEKKDMTFRKTLFGGFSRADVIQYISANAQQWNNQKECLERKIAEGARSCGELEKQLAEATQNNEELKERIGQLEAERQENGAVAAELARALAFSETLKQENESLLQVNNDLRAENGALKAENEGLTDHLTACTEERDVFQRQAEELTVRLQDTEAELRALQEQVARLESEKADLGKRTVSFENVTDRIAELVASLRK